MVALVLVALVVSFAIAAWCALEAIRENNDLRSRLREIEAQKPAAKNAAR